MTAYDNWRCHDHSSEQQAAYEQKHAALSAEIRSGLRLSDYITEIEVDSSFDPKVCQAITEAFYGGDGKKITEVLHSFAMTWLENHANKLAIQRLQGMED
jgi:hypothetical protein